MMVLKTQGSQYLDIQSICSFNGSTTFDPSKNIVTLTEAINSQAGAVVGKTALDMKHDFTFIADIYIGDKQNGADGIAIAFHKGSIGFIGEHGGGLGILAAPEGIGFEIDTYWDADADEKGDTFNHGTINGPHAGFVQTNMDIQYLKAMTDMQRITPPNDTWRTLAISWKSSNATLSATLSEEGSDSPAQTWTLNNAGFDLDNKYTFLIGSSTGGYNNKHQIGIKKFEAFFTKPKLEAHSIEVSSHTSFNPLTHEEIGLKATDLVDGDITDKITVEENDVDTTKAGIYKVTYKVVNSYGESDETTITVTVPVVDDAWEDGNPSGWKFFSGDSITLEENQDVALVGNWVFYSDRHVAIYKPLVLEETQQYRMTVCVKPEDEGTIPFHNVKVSLKSDPSSADSFEVLNTRLASGESIEKGYLKLVSEAFTPSVLSTNKSPIIIIENFLAGWIGLIKITLEPTK
ncbi:lectin-like domain-containing protein [Priestia megaterium]|uniref:lectin-like domain-containing protein n=1 Tax=Priestia megaterium TaxID=1404 RepID=UPI00112A7CB7|nr:immunoglobulin-like domain-containing protein [Priestia megaterium]TPF18419.1 DUF5011 domain-containing protein [Priestia megaterium]TPF22529.1 DUF5011 domain-containing protein [Priestia megaterium]